MTMYFSFASFCSVQFFHLKFLNFNFKFNIPAQHFSSYNYLTFSNDKFFQWDNCLRATNCALANWKILLTLFSFWMEFSVLRTAARIVNFSGWCLWENFGNMCLFCLNILVIFQHANGLFEIAPSRTFTN